MADDPSPYRAGESALIATVPEADPVVGRWRQRYDTAAGDGVPAHITMLAPFLDRVPADVLDELAALFARHRAFDVRLAQPRRFPGVLYLAPEPDGPCRALTDAIARRWPEAPPYGGQFEDVVPHLTVADSQPDPVLDAIEAELAGHLPVRGRVTSVSLYVYDGQTWREHHRFPLSA